MTIATKLLALLGVLLLVALSHAAALGAQASQASLVKAWEDVQREDPETVTFEKTGEGSYRFKTKRFPFDGELKLLKATINDYSYDEEGHGAPSGFVTGVIEYDLVGLSEEVEKKYEHSYFSWQMNNTLYFDVRDGEWLSLDEYRAKSAAATKKAADEQQRQQQRKQQQEESSRGLNLWLNLVSWWGPIIVLVGFWVWFFKKDRKSTRLN